MNKSATNDIPFEFGTKATTLARLASRLTAGRLCEQEIVPVGEWRQEPTPFVDRIIGRFKNELLAVRSSAVNEDTAENSNAGVFLSLTAIASEPADIEMAVNSVIASYGTENDIDQVLVQPMVRGTVISGVVSTKDIGTGGPYMVVDYDDISGRTDTVTAGALSKTLYIHRSKTDQIRSSRFQNLIAAVQEIERITACDDLDIEFCINHADDVFILQVRPLAARHQWSEIESSHVDKAIERARLDLQAWMSPDFDVAGRTTVFGNMPDWNPAEILGSMPKPLAVSLYQKLITDRVWAEARKAMGYRWVDRPLLNLICGRPYVNVRLSLNSFLPAGLSPAVSEKIIDNQIGLLTENRDLHDKIEFELAVTCWDFNFTQSHNRLRSFGLTDEEVREYERCLDVVTKKALREGRAYIPALLNQASALLEPDDVSETLPLAKQIAGRLEHCAASGTYPFAILARHGFIAKQLLNSLIACGVLSETEANLFLRSIRTVATDFVDDLAKVSRGDLSQEWFLSVYGHLRPGTYDINSLRYDENSNHLFANLDNVETVWHQPFRLDGRKRMEIDFLLANGGFDLNADALIGYLEQATVAREFSKFCFTRSLSDTFSLIERWGSEIGLDRNDLSFLTLEEITLYPDAKQTADIITERKREYSRNRMIRLPHILCEPSDIDIIRIPTEHPTFITNKIVNAPGVHLVNSDHTDVDGKIVLIESADPGYDWIFAHHIVGLVTKYGGANSHMSIRCAEFGLPAAIGCGERNFTALTQNTMIELNCASHKLSAFS